MGHAHSVTGTKHAPASVTCSRTAHPPARRRRQRAQQRAQPRQLLALLSISSPRSSTSDSAAARVRSDATSRSRTPAIGPAPGAVATVATVVSPGDPPERPLPSSLVRICAAIAGDSWHDSQPAWVLPPVGDRLVIVQACLYGARAMVTKLRGGVMYVKQRLGA